MKLKKLIKNIPNAQFKGPKDVEITGICENSRLVAPGNLFIAKRAKEADGINYISQALAAGANAILTDIYDPFIKNAAQIVHPSISDCEALLLENYYNKPYNELFQVGITGTCGKTTTSYLVKHIFDALGISCGLMGTIEYIIGKTHHLATHTTPTLSQNHRLLREMVLHKCEAAVMEVSSHALDQGRVRNIVYDVEVFTNISSEHMEYHHTFENYFATKRKFFTHPVKGKKNTVAVLNGDDPLYEQMKQDIQTPVLTFGIENSKADLKAKDVVVTLHGTRCNLLYQEKEYPLTFPLTGRYNLLNALAAICVGLIKGFSLIDICRVLSQTPSIPGRLDLVYSQGSPKVYIDYAHKDDALRKVLLCLNEVKQKGRIITVFGCGGNRDRYKRPKMAKVCQELSDYTIVTSDNPREENPQAIINEIIQGFTQSGSYEVEADRYEAIKKAINSACEDDIVLIAGKGHEAYQIFAHHTIEFNDKAVAQAILSN